MWVKITFEAAVFSGFLFLLALCATAWCFSRLPNRKPYPWQWLEKDRSYRILSVETGWNPQLALVQDEMGAEQPFSLALSEEDEFTRFIQGAIIKRIEEEGVPRLYSSVAADGTGTYHIDRRV